MDSNKSSFRTITRLLNVLEILASHSNGLTLAEVVNKLDAPKSSIYYLLQEMQKMDISFITK